MLSSPASLYGTMLTVSWVAESLWVMRCPESVEPCVPASSPVYGVEQAARVRTELNSRAGVTNFFMVKAIGSLCMPFTYRNAEVRCPATAHGCPISPSPAGSLRKFHAPGMIHPTPRELYRLAQGRLANTQPDNPRYGTKVAGHMAVLTEDPGMRGMPAWKPKTF